jgi:hypothetical protein
LAVAKHACIQYFQAGGEQINQNQQYDSAFFGSGIKVVVVTVFFVLLLASESSFAAPQYVSPKDPEHSSPAQVLSSGELARLRPVVERDLKEIVKRVYNEDAPTTADLNDAFNECRVVKFNLGRLGEAVLVEGIGPPAVTMAMLNVYLRTKESYRLVMAGSGFGPYLIPGRDGIPYLMFGYTVGAGTEKLYRYHYSGNTKKYEVDACDDHESKDLVCHGEHLPTFPDPY